jgi:predicted O-linked N-acetylglucosamine transferase (SPINDLY family)
LQLQSSIGSRAFQNARLQKQARKQAEALLPAAVAVYRQGRHAEAQALCQQILKDLPNHFDALHLLGTSQVNCSRFEEAVATLTRTIGVDPRSADAQSNLGAALSELGRYEEARRCLERAIALKPNFPMALTNLGKTLMHLGQFETAIAAHDRAIALKPDFADAYCHRGQVLMLTNRAEEADQDFGRALSLNPRQMAAVLGKALVNVDLRNYEIALTHMNAALATLPTAADVLAQRGRLYMQMAELDKAEADFDAAIRNDPRQESALCGKANILLLRGDVTRAAPLCHRVLKINLHSELALTLLGGCFAAVGDPATAIAHFDRALASKPDYEEAIKQKIFVLDFVPDIDFVTLQEARKYWWDQIGARQPQRQLQACSLDPERRIVVGYVSADFRDHSAAIAFMPWLRLRDHERFQVICYSNSPLQDATTALCRSLADQWVDAWRLTDDKLADRIEADQVDILVDLSGHSGGNRLSVFATKPAPIQVTAIGHVSGTGLPTMDYLLADPILIPAEARPLFAERIHDLPAFITIEPPPDIAPTPLPALGNGYVTFGAFNRADKISDAALSVWSKLMQAVPGSVIVVKNAALNDALVRDTLIARFVASGIPENRLRCVGSSPRPEHLALVSSIDIMLDPFPQNGGVSTWEPLQLGVPVVTKLGNGHASRCGGAIVVAAGLGDWVAADDEGYIEIARRWATSPDELAALRARLPAQVRSSAAGNCLTYVGHLEEGYRKFWRDYCAGAADVSRENCN